MKFIRIGILNKSKISTGLIFLFFFESSESNFHLNVSVNWTSTITLSALGAVVAIHVAKSTFATSFGFDLIQVSLDSFERFSNFGLNFGICGAVTNAACGTATDATQAASASNFCIV